MFGTVNGLPQRPLGTANGQVSDIENVPFVNEIWRPDRRFEKGRQEMATMACLYLQTSLLRGCPTHEISSVEQGPKVAGAPGAIPCAGLRLSVSRSGEVPAWEAPDSFRQATAPFEKTAGNKFLRRISLGPRSDAHTHRDTQ